MTATTAKTKKQTAANNAFLADVKHHFNKPLFEMASKLVNAKGLAGEGEMRAYLVENVVRTLDFLPTRRSY